MTQTIPDRLASLNVSGCDKPVSNFKNMIFTSPDSQTWVGKKLPDFTLYDSNGKVYTNESINGKLTVINLWSIACHLCIDEMPLLSKLVDRDAGRNVIFLAPAPETLDRIDCILAHQRPNPENGLSFSA